MSDTLTENQTIGFHLCENQMWENQFLKNKNKSENPVRFDPLIGSGFQSLAVIIFLKYKQAMRKKVMSIELNYVFIQDGTTIYLLDLGDHSWTMGLNFGCMVLNQLNLIRAKKNTFITIPSSKSAF